MRKTLSLLLVFVVASMAAIAPSAVSAGPSTSVIVLGDSAGEVSAAVTNAGGSVTMPLELVDGVVAEVTGEARAVLRRHEDVHSVTPNRQLEVQSSSYEDGPAANHNVSTGAAPAHSQGLDGSGVGIALLDTGVADHPDLEGRIAAAADLTSDHTFGDEYGHGTFMAGLIAGTGASSRGRYTGVAPGAHIMSVKISGADGTMSLGQVLYGLQLIDSSKETYGIRVVVIALSSPAVTGPDPLVLAVERLWADGLFVVVSAGNSGPDVGTITSPAVDPYVLTTGASNENGTGDVADDTIAPWSARGPSIYGMTKPEIVSPGTSLVSLRAAGSTVDASYPSARVGSHYFKGSGTSMSAAVAGGAAAIVLQADPSLTPDELKGRIMGSAHEMPGAPDHAAGKGTIDVMAALSSTASPANQDLPGLPARQPAGVPVDPVQGAKQSSFEWVPGPQGVDRWEGRGWGGRGWGGRGWGNADWSGRGWGASQWAGRGWAGRGWAGSRWSNADWSGRGWAGGTWAWFLGR